MINTLCCIKLIYLFFIGVSLVGAQVNYPTANSACFGENDYCLQFLVTKDLNLEFTVLSSKEGWAAFGIGKNMMDSDIYVGWVNSKGDPVVSRRTSRDYVLPVFNPNSNFNVTKLAAGETKPWVKLGFKVTQRMFSGVYTIPIIFAHSDSKPDDVDDPRSTFPFHHNNRGRFNRINLLGGGGESTVVDVSENTKAIFLAHGILFFIAWGFAPFVGIFVARYLKNAMGVWWYRVHLGIFLGITGLLSVISFFLIYANTGVSHPHFHGTHHKIGLAIFILMFFQFALGYTSNALWDPKRRAVPWWDVLHWYFGRSLLLLALCNICLGVAEYIGHTLSKTDSDSTDGLKLAFALIGYGVYIGIMFSIMIIGHFYFGGTQHHIEKHSEEVVDNSE